LFFLFDNRTKLEHYDSNELTTPVINPYNPCAMRCEGSESVPKMKEH